MAIKEWNSSEKMNTQSAKMSQNTPFASFFIEKFPGEVPGTPPPTLQNDIP